MKRLTIFLLLSLTTHLNGQDTKRIKVACLGASITEGAFLNNPSSESFPGQLQQILGNGYDVRNYGVGGTTLLTKGDHPYINTGQYKQALASSPDIVFIDLGGNDAKLINRIYLKTFEQNYVELIQSLKNLSSHPRIILMTPVTSFVTDTTGIWDVVIRERIVPRVRSVAYREHVEVFDMYPLFLGKPELYFDGIHPRLEGATTMATRLKDLLKQERDIAFDIFKNISVRGETSSYMGYECITFKISERECKIVKPKVTNAQHRWIWRARFWGHEPQTEVALLELGYHVVYCDVAELFGNDEAIDRWNRFYKLLADAGLYKQAAMEGMSRGAVYVYNWAIKYPERVSSVYVDNPLLDLMWWPARQYTEKMPERKEWEMFKKDYGYTNDNDALQFKNSPIDNAKLIAKGGYPMLHVCGDADQDAPMNKNTNPFVEKINSYGGKINVIVKMGFKHHPHSLPDPTPIVEFIVNAEGRK